ncbi:P27 family phage terminase small subunit [Cohaesibacter haloalkalitolerans]|uniref:P27 family phage terminase small subunit n=1 Tax=Cohaesibacter haloalkalitolerans TaxID=1162980 RepID=UPI000E65588F|nr:P27 family phage terminase small subunit [Cohaesibacter haloalkalitolerans]
MARGRKPDFENVVRFKNDGGIPFEEQCEQLAAELKPFDLTEYEALIWDRIAPQLAEQQRLKAHFVDTVAEYCRALIRMRALRSTLLDEGETYVVEGRNGKQYKSRPEVAQLNETWRQWRNLTAALGLTPVDERGLAAGQGDLFPPGGENPFAGMGA